jgi:hypothetical protein
MKVLQSKQKKEGFTPVILLIENQREFNQIYAYFNHNNICVSALDMPWKFIVSELKNLWTDKDYTLHGMLRKICG